MTLLLRVRRWGLARDAVAAVLAGARATGAALRLTLTADNDFYSQREQLVARGAAVTLEALRALPACMPCPTGATRQRRVLSLGRCGCC